MLEVFAGGAVLTSVAKQFGLGGMAIDKIRKQNARCTIYQLDLLQADDRELLEEWLSSPLLLWAHFAPVCVALQVKPGKFPGLNYQWHLDH